MSWIPANSKLPEIQGDYLVVVKNQNTGDRTIAIKGFSHDLHKVDRYAFHSKKYNVGWYEFDNQHGYCEVKNILYWDYLPDFPK